MHTGLLGKPIEYEAPVRRRGWNLQWLLWAVLAFAAVTRFYALADKPLHHDESLFAYYSYFLYKGWGYEYQPILHGPILENVTALVFLLFGDSNFTMRIPAALGGIGLLLVAWFWRRYLGGAGAAAALLLIAFSPSITYYSRFLRNDVPYLAVTCWTALLLVIALQTGRRKYVWWAIFAAAIMFCMMESSIFFFAACVGFLVVATVADWLAGAREDVPRRMPGDAVFFVPRVRGESPRGVTRGVALWSVPLAILITAFLAWFFYRMFYSTLHIYKPVVALAGKAGLYLAPRTANVLITALTLPTVYVLCLIVAANWRRPIGRHAVLHYFVRVVTLNRWIILSAFAASVLLFTVLFTTWFTHVRGKDFWGNEVLLTPLQIYKNTWDYWWDQHKLHRIKGPFHYYLPILFLYELPAILLVLRGWWKSLTAAPHRWRHLLIFVGTQALAFAIYMAATTIASKSYGKKIDWDVLDKTLHITGPGHIFIVLFYVQILTHLCGLLVVRRRFVEAFLTFWMVTSLFAYSYAGEKVPWLTVHVAGPLAILAGYYVQRWFVSGTWTRRRAVVALTIASLALLYQFRTQVWANFRHPHSPAERIVYNHTSPDIEYAVAQVHEIAFRANQGRQLPIFARGEMEWPLFWYFRAWPNAAAPATETAENTNRAVVLVNWEASNIPNLTQNYEIQRLKVREWWEPPLLDFPAMLDIFRILTPRESRRAGDGMMRWFRATEEWKKLWHYMAYRQIWLDREDPWFSNGANEFAFCVRKDLAESLYSYRTLQLMPKRPEIPVYP
jgi:uncharacterized protein (TIGR03663 family)